MPLIYRKHNLQFGLSCAIAIHDTSSVVGAASKYGERESREVAKLLQKELESGIPPQKVIEHLQKSIVNTDAQSEFLCMYNEKGIELCHPDPALIGQKIERANSDFEVNRKLPVVIFKDVLRSGKPINGIRTFPAATKRSSEIVNVYPVRGSN